MNGHRWDELSRNMWPRPGLIGLDLQFFPFISGYGLLLRAMRLNEFSRRDLCAVFGIRAFKDLNVIQACSHLGAPRKYFVNALELQSHDLTKYWSEDEWCPIHVGNRWRELVPPLRYCPECLRYGYHCTLFQMPFMHRCPWHADYIISDCLGCGRPINVGMREDGRLGLCECGNDLFDRLKATLGIRSFPSEEATAYLQKYLDWCSTQSSQRRMVAPSLAASWYPALEQLVKLPRELAPAYASPQTSPHQTITWTAAEAFKPRGAPGEFLPWIVMGVSHPLSIAPLPKRLHRPLVRVTRAIAATFPAKTRIQSGSKEYCLGELVADRPHHFIYPVGISLQDKTWLHLTTVEPNALELCGLLIRTIDDHIAGPTFATETHSAEVERSENFDSLDGSRCLRCALFHILLRGFAIGLQMTLIRWSPRSKTKAAKSRRLLPIAEIQATRSHLKRISITWIESPPAVAKHPATRAKSRRKKPLKRKTG